MIVQNSFEYESYYKALYNKAKYIHVKGFVKVLMQDKIDLNACFDYLSIISVSFTKLYPDSKKLNYLNLRCKQLMKQFKKKKLIHKTIFNLVNFLVDTSNNILDESVKSEKIKMAIDVNKKHVLTAKKDDSGFQSLKWFRKKSRVALVTAIISVFAYFWPGKSVSNPNDLELRNEAEAIVSLKMQIPNKMKEFEVVKKDILDLDVPYILDEFNIRIDKKTGVPLPPPGYKLSKIDKAIITGYTPRGKGLMHGVYKNVDDGKTAWNGKNAYILNGIAVNSSPKVTFRNSKLQVVKTAKTDKFIPYGSIVYIPGVGMKIADDAGGRMKTDAIKGMMHVDVRVKSGRDAKNITKASETIYIFEPVNNNAIVSANDYLTMH